jgi:hypothetical protein
MFVQRNNKRLSATTWFETALRSLRGGKSNTAAHSSGVNIGRIDVRNKKHFMAGALVGQHFVHGE